MPQKHWSLLLAIILTRQPLEVVNGADSYTSHCAKGYSVDYRSYIKYECDKDVEAGIKIIVLYNTTKVERSKCPEAVRWSGTYKSMVYKGTDGKYYWDYQSVKDAFDA